MNKKDKLFRKLGYRKNTKLIEELLAVLEESLKSQREITISTTGLQITMRVVEEY